MNHNHRDADPVAVRGDGGGHDDRGDALEAGLAARLRAGPPPGAAGTDAAGAALDALVAATLVRADAYDLVDVAWTVADTPIGPLTLAATGAGVVRIAFGDEDAVLDELSTAVSPRVLHLPSRLDAVRRQLDEYFAGRRHVFDLRLDRRLSRGFRRQVLDELVAGVPYGETVSYKDLAVRAHNPGAVRAVGTAMATNPIPIVVPCHRVLPSSGALGRYGGGPEIKAWLLRLEGARLML